MTNTTHSQVIAEEAAIKVVEKFLQSLPEEILNQLPLSFIEDTSHNLKADIQSCIHSRLQWSEQSAHSEILEHQREVQANTQVQFQRNFLPHEPIQRLSESELRRYKRHNQQVSKQSVALDNPIYVDKHEVIANTPNNTKSHITLNRSPNRQRRRRRRSPVTEHQESLLNST